MPCTAHGQRCPRLEKARAGLWALRAQLFDMSLCSLVQQLQVLCSMVDLLTMAHQVWPPLIVHIGAIEGMLRGI